MCSRSTTRYLWYDRIPGGYVVRAAPGSVEEWLAAKERNALHPWGFQIFDDFVFKFLRVFVAGLEIPDGGVEAVDAVEGATGDVKGVAHAFSVGDNEGFVVGDHPLGHAPAIPLTGFRIVGKTVGGYGGATPGLAGRKVMALGFGLGRMQLRHDSLLTESISSRWRELSVIRRTEGGQHHKG